jgi:hypothetical protein
MMRHIVAAAGVLAMMSGLAMAETTAVVRTDPGYVAAAPHKTTVVKKRVNRYGQLVKVKKTHRDGFYGSSTTRTRTVTDPATGVSTKTRMIERE